MCSDENGAPNTVRYLNAQLAVLHENARRCLEEHDQARTEDNKNHYALAEFIVQKPGTSEVVFQAAFDKPELEFICDHDAVLHLTLCSGIIIQDNLRGGRKGREIQLPPDLRLTYRIGFETRRIVGNDHKIGGYGSTIQLVILDLKKGTFVSAEPEPVAGRDLLVRYMAEYLEQLHSAGHHVLFSLPQFDQRGSSMTIDYSLMGNTQFWVGDIHGITVEQINTYMSSVWLKSAMLAHGATRTSTDWRLRSLAEFSTIDLGGSAYGTFRVKLGPPRVEILCNKEVIVYFKIEELDCFMDDDFSTDPERCFKDWKIAMVVNVLYSCESEGNVVNISFDLSHARFHGFASEYPGLEEHDELGMQIWRHIVNFFSDDYLHILESSRYHIIYSRDTRWEAMSQFTNTTQEDADGSWWSLDLTDTSGVSSRETVQRTKMHGFDQVVAISQGSINAQFSALATNVHSMFYRWSYEKYFAASFKPLSMLLLSNNRAIVWVHLSGGHMRTLRDWLPWDGGMGHDIGEWRLAFEVELKMCAQDELEGATSDAYRNSPAYEKHGNRQDRVLKHIYLDFRNAEYLHDFSTFGDLSSGGDNRSSILKLQAVVYYITQHYFTAICKDAQHIISSIPVWTSGQSLPSYALTSVAFHVYSKVEVTRYNWAHVTAGTEPIVVVFGMTGFRSLVSDHLDFSTGWIVQGTKGFSHGTFGITKRVFIEERVLNLLSRVNALTTLIPSNPDAIMHGFRNLKLIPWAQHESRKDRPSKWELQPSDGDGYLKYLWEHCEGWSYNLSGNSNMMSAAHGVSCITRNYVELPTAVKQGAMRIKISGKVELKLTLLTDQLYAASSSISWSTHITVQTVGSGIKVSTAGSHPPEIMKATFSGDGASNKLRSPMEMLHEAFPPKVDLDELVQEISAFEGAWQYYYPLAHPYSLASPIFNDDGDLLFELRRHGTTAARVPMSPNSTQSGRSPRRPGFPRLRTPVGGTPRSPSAPRTPSPSLPPPLNLHTGPPPTQTTFGASFGGGYSMSGLNVHSVAASRPIPPFNVNMGTV